MICYLHSGRGWKSLLRIAHDGRGTGMNVREARTGLRNADTQKTAAASLNLAVRFLLELGALAALAYWGFHSGSGTGAKVALAIGAPLCMAVVWGLIAAPRAAITLAAPIRFVVGLAILCLAALALAAAGQRALAVAFAAIIVLNAALLATWKQ